MGNDAASFYEGLLLHFLLWTKDCSFNLYDLKLINFYQFFFLKFAHSKSFYCLCLFQINCIVHVAFFCYSSNLVLVCGFIYYSSMSFTATKFTHKHFTILYTVSLLYGLDIFACGVVRWKPQQHQKQYSLKLTLRNLTVFSPLCQQTNVSLIQGCMELLKTK